MGTRKNQRDLNATEKRNFVDAVVELKRRGQYDDFVRTHNEFITTDSDFGPRVGHVSPSFLPWHRQYLLDFERALQAINPAVDLPYWDWTTDRSTTSSLWAADFLGGNGRQSDSQVTTGPFAFGTGNWRILESTDTRPYLRRRMGASATVSTLPTRAQVDTVLATTTYDAAPWNSSSRTGFRNALEGGGGSTSRTHNRVHVWVGGNMATGGSPNDPVFWLHHCFIDKLWSDWQRARPTVGYAPTAPTRDVVALNETMRPWGNVRPADMLNHAALYTYA